MVNVAELKACRIAKLAAYSAVAPFPLTEWALGLVPIQRADGSSLRLASQITPRPLKMDADGPICALEKSTDERTRGKSEVAGPARKVMAWSVPPALPFPLRTVTVAALTNEVENRTRARS